MKRTVAFLVGSVALLGSQTAMASAPYIAPAATPSWIFNGDVDVYKGIPLTCQTTVTISGPNNASDTNPPFSHTDVSNLSATITLAGGTLNLCNVVEVAPIPAGSITYASNGASGGTFTLHDVFVTTITPGNCEGDIAAVWNESAQTLTVSGTLPAVSGSDCTMNGTVDLTSPASGNASGAGDADHNPNHGNV